jgi:bifunctional DNase/RNase
MSIENPNQDHEIISVHVITLIENPDDPVLCLYCQSTNKIIRIHIGKPESKILALALDKSKFERPMSHNLMLELIDALHGEIRHIIIYDLHKGVFHAKICIQMYDKLGLLMEVQVESRPSDAFILAVLADKPIYVTDTVIEKAGEVNPLGKKPLEEHFTPEQIESLKKILHRAQKREQET